MNVNTTCKSTRLFAIGFLTALVIAACSPQQGTENPFWHGGNESLEVQQIFDDERLPNIVVTTEGTVLATYGRWNYKVRRSEDGGVTWGPEILVGTGDNWLHGGRVTVDENSGDILTFLHHGDHTGNDSLHVYRSTDDGRTWQRQEAVFHPDENGNTLTGHMSETGITLQHGPNTGRLLRPARWFGSGNKPKYHHEHYNSALYSDDGGRTWHASAPFPARGTGEGAVAELSDGRIYYNSRRHWAPEGENPLMRHIAWSYDGGETWEDLEVSDELPDGPQHHRYGLMGGLVRLPVEGHDILLFSNVDVPVDEKVDWDERTKRRKRGTIWVSFDGGETWPVKRLIEEGYFAYSSLAAGREGTPSEGWIYLLYETGGRSAPANVARFNLDWVTEGRDWKEFLPG